MRNSLRRKFQGLGVGLALCFLGYGSYQARLEDQADFEKKQQQIVQNEESTNEGEDVLVAQWLKSQTGSNSLNSVVADTERTPALSANVIAKYDASLALKKTKSAAVGSKANEADPTAAAAKTPTEKTAGAEVKPTEEVAAKEADAVITEPTANSTPEAPLPTPEAGTGTTEDTVVEFPLLVNVGGIYLAATDKTAINTKAVQLEQSATATANIRYLFTLTETVATLWDSKNWSNQTTVALLEKNGTTSEYQILDSVKTPKTEPNATFAALKLDVDTYKTKGVTEDGSLRETLLLSYTTDKETTYWIAARPVPDDNPEGVTEAGNSASES